MVAKLPMSKKINNKFSLALITSIALHVTLIMVLGYSAWQYASPLSNNGQGDSIEAIMVDSSIMTEQYQRQLQHQVESQQVKQQQQEQIEKQSQELQQKQLAEQQRLKELEKERLLAIEKQKQIADAAEAERQRILQEATKAKAELEEQQKQALLAKQKAEEEKLKALAEAEKAKLEAEKQKQLLEQQRLKAEEEKQKAELAAKQKAEQEAKQKAELEAKQKAEQEAKQKAEQEAKQKALNEQQQQKALDDILGGLTSSEPKSQRGVSTGELDQFKSQVHSAITNKFINPKLYSGKNCVLKIEIDQNGWVKSVVSDGGDPALCREAISATYAAKFPKPKSELLFQQVKKMTIDFRPK